MDTYFDVKWDKCVKCYDCVMLCTDLHIKRGCLGLIHIDEEGYPDIWSDNPPCKHCEAEINGKKVNYPCNKLCKHGAMNITRC